MDEVDKYNHFASVFYKKLTNDQAILQDNVEPNTADEVEKMIGIADDFIESNKAYLQKSQLHREHMQFIGNESTKKISKEDFMNFTGHSYDEYIKERANTVEEDPDAQRPRGGRRKRSSKTRRSMRKGNKKKRVKTRRRK